MRHRQRLQGMIRAGNDAAVTGREWSRRAVTDDQSRSHDSAGGSTGRVASQGD